MSMNIDEQLADAIDAENWVLVKKLKAQLSKSNKRGRKAKGIVKGGNKFVDNLEEASEFIEESRKLSEKKRFKQYRPPVKLIKVNCAVCGGEEEVDGSIAQGVRAFESKYVCSGCTPKTSRGN